MADVPFWKGKTLTEMTREEWDPSARLRAVLSGQA